MLIIMFNFFQNILNYYPKSLKKSEINKLKIYYEVDN